MQDILLLEEKANPPIQDRGGVASPVRILLMQALMVSFMLLGACWMNSNAVRAFGAAGPKDCMLSREDLDGFFENG